MFLCRNSPPVSSWNWHHRLKLCLFPEVLSDACEDEFVLSAARSSRSKPPQTKVGSDVAEEQYDLIPASLSLRTELLGGSSRLLRGGYSRRITSGRGGRCRFTYRSDENNRSRPRCRSHKTDVRFDNSCTIRWSITVRMSVCFEDCAGEPEGALSVVHPRKRWYPLLCP